MLGAGSVVRCVGGAGVSSVGAATTQAVRVTARASGTANAVAARFSTRGLRSAIAPACVRVTAASVTSTAVRRALHGAPTLARGRSTQVAARAASSVAAARPGAAAFRFVAGGKGGSTTAVVGTASLATAVAGAVTASSWSLLQFPAGGSAVVHADEAGVSLADQLRQAIAEWNVDREPLADEVEADAVLAQIAERKEELKVVPMWRRVAQGIMVAGAVAVFALPALASLSMLFRAGLAVLSLAGAYLMQRPSPEVVQLDALVAQVEARKDILALKIPYELLPVEVKALLQTAATELAASEGVTKVVGNIVESYDFEVDLVALEAGRMQVLFKVKSDKQLFKPMTDSISPEEAQSRAQLIPYPITTEFDESLGEALCVVTLADGPDAESSIDFLEVTFWPGRLEDFQQAFVITVKPEQLGASLVELFNRYQEASQRGLDLGPIFTPAHERLLSTTLGLLSAINGSQQ